MAVKRSPTFALLCLVLLVGLTACGQGYLFLSDDGSTSVNGAPPPTSVLVPVVEGVDGGSYISSGVATLTNEEYAGGDVLGTVTIRAASRTKNPASNTHFFSATVTQTDGAVVTCAESRSHIWSDFGVPEDIPMPCDVRFDLRLVGTVRLGG